jgi:hypothetical protein
MKESRGEGEVKESDSKGCILWGMRHGFWLSALHWEAFGGGHNTGSCIM